MISSDGAACGTAAPGPGVGPGAAPSAGGPGGRSAGCPPAYVHRPTDPLSAAFMMVRQVRSGHDGFADYVRSSFAASAVSPAPPRSLFPMAAPYGWSHGHPPRDAPGRTAWRLRRAEELLVNLMVLALSYLSVRGLRRCPDWARTGGPLSVEQRSAAAFLRERVSEYLAPSAAASDRSFRSAQLVADCARMGTLPLGAPCDKEESRATRLDPARATFAKTDADFDPTPFLGVFAAACYVEPDLLHRSRLPRGILPADAVASGPQRGLQCDVLGYLRKWDERHRLLLEPPWTTCRTQQGTLFAVPKTEDVDRVVFNRIPRNAQEVHLPGYARFCIGGHDFTELLLGPGTEVKLFADDLSDAFPAFRASRARGVSNALAWTAPVAAFAGTRAYHDLQRNCLRRGLDMPSRVRPCYLGLPMGDLNAADFCAEAHTRVLRSAGSFPHERAFTNGGPVPRGGAIEALVIDDHVGIAVDAPGSSVNADILEESFRNAADGYGRANLHTSKGKARRGARGGIVLGAEFVPGSPFLGTDRVRRRHLAEGSMLLADGGRCSRHLLRRLLGSWVHALLYRRPMMSLLSAAFAFVGEAGDLDHHVVRLPHAVRCELKTVGVLAGLMVSNLGADFADRIVCSDASPYAEGAVAAAVPRAVQQELWRHRERRGAYTRVYGHWASQLRLAGLKADAEALEEDRHGTSPSPERVLIETFDFVEVCCGTRSPLCDAVRREGLRVGPRIDLAAHGMWDITVPRVVEWMLFLAERRRVWWWHSGVPCTDFSVAKHPTVRTHAAPWGFAPKDSERAKPNFMLAVVGMLILVLVRVGFGTLVHEHPASAHSWAIKFWEWFVTLADAEIGRFCACQFGAPYRKDTRLARLRADCLRPLDRMCCCTGPHAVSLAGGETKKAAEYVPRFCTEYAAAAAAVHRADPPALGQDEAAAMATGTPACYEKFWINDLLRELPWVPTASRPVGGDAHINVRELRAGLRHGVMEARGARGLRILLVLDSRVSIGALGKGRSAAQLLNNELRAALPEILGQDLYLGFLFGPTRLNPADAPSRLRPLASTGLGLPPWARALMRGDTKEFDWLTSLPDQSHRTMGWACLTLRLAKARGCPLSPKELPFDATLGYPGEGPSASRPALDLRQHRALTPAVAARRRIRLRELVVWSSMTYSLSLPELLDLPSAELDRVLAEFGQLLWQAGRSLLDFAETINSVVDQNRALKGHLPRAWDAAWVWRTLIPSGNRMPMPEKVMMAMVTVALRWDLPHVALLLATGFVGLLRVHELRWLRFGSFVTPRRMMADDAVMFVVIDKPKMRRLGARRSYVRIDDPGLIAFAEGFAAGMPADALVFDDSYAQLRSVFMAICGELGLPSGTPEGLSLGSLRPGGATWLYRVTDCTETVRFRGRWASSRMLEIYIQEVGAASVLPQLSPQIRARIQELATAAPLDIANFLAAFAAGRSY